MADGGHIDITWETNFIEDQENFVVESVPFRF